jgi:hypothetical protein
VVRLLKDLRGGPSRGHRQVSGPCEKGPRGQNSTQLVYGVPRYLGDLEKEKGLEKSDWRVERDTGVYEEPDGHSCGVYVCLTALLLCAGKTVKVTPPAS